MRVLLVGCGYVGIPLGTELAGQGHEVFGLRRSTEGLEKLRASGIQGVQADITVPDQLARLPGPFDWVVNVVSSSHGTVTEYQQVYLAGMKNLVEWLASA